MGVPIEINCDTLVGPSHFFGGLAAGNLASQHALGQESSPREAALQGLHKMRWVYDLTGKQLILPPQPRPFLPLIRACDGEDYAEFATRFPQWVPLVMSSAFMWTANAATVIPSVDAADGKVHFFAANLMANPHRAIEAEATTQVLRDVFRGSRFVHHGPIPYFSDEGAANQCRLFDRNVGRGFHLLVHGFSSLDRRPVHRRYWPRQSAEAHAWMVGKTGLDDTQWMAAKQTAGAVDCGVFHNDVICASHETLLVLHQAAFDDQSAVLSELHTRAQCTGISLRVVEVSHQELDLSDTVKSYLFNAQFVTDRQGDVHLLVPRQAVGVADVVMDRLKRDGGVDHIHSLDLTQSMKNGGGPACLRLRIWLTSAEQDDVNPAFWASDTLLNRLETHVRTHYPDQLTMDDFTDAKTVRHLQSVGESVSALF